MELMKQTNNLWSPPKRKQVVLRTIELNIQKFYKKALEFSGIKNVQLRYLALFSADKGFNELEIEWTDK